MTQPNIEEQIKEIIAEYLGVNTDRVTDEAVFGEDLGADSLDEVEICMVIEEEYDIELPDEQVQTCHTVGQLIQLVKSIKGDT